MYRKNQGINKGKAKWIKYATPQSTDETPSSFCCFRAKHLRKHQEGASILSTTLYKYKIQSEKKSRHVYL